MSWNAALESAPPEVTGRWTLYIYVPLGTREIGLYSAATAGRLLNPEGGTALEFDHAGGAFLSVPVPQGGDGKLWKIYGAKGSVRLLNIPPFLARTPEELVLPADCKHF